MSDDPHSPTIESSSQSTRETTLAMFESFREILDEKNDRYERLVKLSRDLTIQSKRIIFLLHRVAGQPFSPDASKPVQGLDANSAEALSSNKGPSALHPSRAAELEAAKQARAKFDSLNPLFSKIATELEGQEPERYSRAMSVGPFLA